VFSHREVRDGGGVVFSHRELRDGGRKCLFTKR
jgi:hypothetical protein